MAFAASAAHEAALFPDHDIVDLSEEYAYWSAKQHDQPGPGTTFGAMRDAMAARGQPLEEAWPYNERRDDQAAGYHPPEKAHSAQPRWAPRLAAVPATPDSMRAQLEASRAVILGLPTWPGLDNPMAGRLSVPDPAELDGAHHAVAVVGYDEATSEMLLRNSWGVTWGIDGTAWLALRFLDAHVCETWILDPNPGSPVPLRAITSSPRYGNANQETTWS